MKYFRFIIFVISISFSTVSWGMRVLTSVKPIQLISYELMLGVDTPDVLLAANTSPHDYALRPSDVKRIKQADLVIWFGEGLEPFLSKILANNPNVLTISQLPDVDFRHFEAAHDDGHHHQGNFDPHFWLGLETVGDVAQGITARLIQMDPSHTAQYRLNLKNFLGHLKQTDDQIQHQLSAVHQRPYYVFHDAYGYFESHYHLNNIGHFTVTPDRKPGAKTLIHIRQTLMQQPGICIFSEPQFLPAVIESVTRGTNARQGILDPLATDVAVKPGGYFQFLQQLSQHFVQCLSE